MRPVLLACLVVASAAQAQAPPFRFVKDLIPGEALPVLGLADFDLDGDQDLLTNGSGIYLNDGNAWFTPHPVFSYVRASVFDYVPIPKPVVAFGDLNADGFPDVLAWWGTSGYPLVKWVNQGNGALVSVPTGLPSLNGAVVRSIALGDVDGDGDLDAVLALSTTTGLWATAAAPMQLWMNNGAGNFTNAPAPTAALMPSQLALRDFDADGDLDLFVGGSSPVNLAQYALPISPTLMFANAGAGSFSVGTPVPVNSALDVFAIGDVNADGLPDLAADAAPDPFPCSATTMPQVLLNQGGLSFLAAPSTVAGLTRAVPHLVDLDGDGTADLLRSGHDAVAVHLVGSGLFGPPTLTASLFGAPYHWPNSNMLDSATGDVDGDGDIDMVVYTRQGNQILFNDSAAQPVSVPDFLAARPGGFHGVGDVEGDGDVDLVLGAYACTAATPPVMRIASNDGAGNLAEGPPLSCPACPVGYDSAWVFFDADQDGDLDADAFSFPSGSTPKHQILLNSGGAYVAGQTVMMPAVNPVSVVLRTADLDADGDLDVVDAMNGLSNGAQPGHVLLNNGSGSFLTTTLPAHASRDLEIADLDGDGDFDLLAAGVPSSIALLNDGFGGFTPSTTFPSTGASSVEAADLDGDGDVDVVLDNAVFLNVGIGGFSAAGVIPVLWTPNGLHPPFALLDADDDSDVDFLTGWGLLFRNQGTATFSAGETLPFPLTYPNPILHADFDRDGDQDLVARGPSILTNMRRQLARGLPARPGRLASLELGGLPGAQWFLFASPGTGNLPLPPFGTVLLDLATTQLVASGVFSPAGTATVSGTAPTGPGVIGFTLYWQAAMLEPQGLRFSGREVTTIAAY